MESIQDQVESIKAWDKVEQSHIDDCLNWINSGAPIYRIKKPDVPNKHLVSYSVLVDPTEKEILLVEHKNAGLWLPCGGHVEPDENPKNSARRELEEELQITPSLLFDDPIFLTQAVTVGLTAGHTDVLIWYVFEGKKEESLVFDKSEFHSVKWFPIEEIPLEKSDPNMERFLEKLKSILNRQR